MLDSDHTERQMVQDPAENQGPYITEGEVAKNASETRQSNQQVSRKSRAEPDIRIAGEADEMDISTC